MSDPSRASSSSAAAAAAADTGASSSKKDANTSIASTAHGDAGLVDYWDEYGIPRFIPDKTVHPSFAMLHDNARYLFAEFQPIAKQLRAQEQEAGNISDEMKTAEKTFVQLAHAGRAVPANESGITVIQAARWIKEAALRQKQRIVDFMRANDDGVGRFIRAKIILDDAKRHLKPITQVETTEALRESIWGYERRFRGGEREFLQKRAQDFEEEMGGLRDIVRQFKAGHFPAGELAVGSTPFDQHSIPTNILRTSRSDSGVRRVDIYEEGGKGSDPWSLVLASAE